MMNDEIEDIYELSPLQQGMLFHTLYAPNSTVYLEQTILPVYGALNFRLFTNAWQRLLDRHAILRTSFHWQDMDKPIQVVHPSVKVSIDRKDWRNVSSLEREEQLAAYLVSDRQSGFDFSRPPLMRLALIRFTDAEYRLIWSFHHILLDGWSYQLLNHELWSCYEAEHAGLDLELEPTRPYGDYILWLQQQDLAKAEAFWRRTLKGFSAPAFLRVDEPIDPSSDEGDYGAHELALDGTTTSALQDLARQHRLTLNTVIQGAWALLLSRYSGERDVVFGGVVSGRPAVLAGVESMVGLFINTLPVRTQVEPARPVLAWLKELQAQQLEAREYEYTPMIEVQRWSEIPPGLPLFESIVVFENFPTTFTRDSGANELDESGFEPDFSNLQYPERTNYPLCLVVVPHTELRFCFYYQYRRFREGTIRRLAGHLRTLLQALAANPNRRLIDLSLLQEAEKRELIELGNPSRKPYPLDRSLIDLFETQTAATPAAEAFICKGRALTYDDLNRRANQVAGCLEAAGVTREVVVGVCLERSFELAIALLGIWKAGGAYLPLDPACPEERLAWMVADAGAEVVLTEQRFASALSAIGARTICLDTDRDTIVNQSDANAKRQNSPQDLAYVIYTSGSTGTPKGVAVEHKQLLNRFAWMWEAHPFEPNEVCCQKTSLIFVDSLWELLGPLMRGVTTVIMPDEDLQDTAAFTSLLADHRVTRIWLVPSLLRALLVTQPDLQSRLPELKFWVSSGEELKAELLELFRRTMPQAVLYNLYGTSEVWDVTWYDPRTSNEELRRVPIGRPISNVQVLVLDSEKQLAPIGVAGELYVTGDGLARGYTGRPDLTGERFLVDPLRNGSIGRMYRTGDLVRYRPNGDLEFLGRLDSQVKIRGFRVELNEIEYALTCHPGVRETAVIADHNDHGHLRLLAYVVGDRARIDSSQLRLFLQKQLPQYMVPSAFMLLDALPLTRSGKLDRRALPRPDYAAPDGDKRFVQPRTRTEEALVAIWREVLRVEKLGVHENFFELGGDSILSLQIISRAHEAGMRLIPRQLFQHQTIAELAAVTETVEGAPAKSPDARTNTGSIFSASTVDVAELERLISRIDPEEA
jgi:surfactin family lipopeptide synthetase C